MKDLRVLQLVSVERPIIYTISKYNVIRKEVYPAIALVLAKYRTLIVLLLLGALLRIIAIIEFPSLYHPDENFQFLEQAHRLAFGYGIRTWEMRDGIRSLLLPSLFAKIFLLSNWLWGGPGGYIIAARLTLATISLVPIGAVYFMGLRRSRTHALMAGLVVATWFEFVYFSIRPLTEAIATTVLLVALALATTTKPNLSPRRVFAIGFLLASCLMLRVHLVLGLFIVAYVVLQGNFRRLAPYIVLGAIPPIAAFGLSDAVAWGSPFHSYIAAIRINVLEGKASIYGTEPRYWYVLRLVQLWAGAVPVLFALLIIRWRESWMWLAVAGAIIISHSFIPHKEYRFILPALACLVIVAAMASADVVEYIQHRVRKKHVSLVCGAVIAFWLATSFSLAAAPGFSPNWFKRSELIETFFSLSSQPKLCGLLLYDYSWGATGGYTFLHRDIPIYETRFGQEEEVISHRQTYNFVVLKRYSANDFAPEFTLKSCLGNGAVNDVCIAVRTGMCSSVDGFRPLLETNGLGEEPLAGDPSNIREW
jgi:GPI mannosyltransferase 3